ncbi:MAG: spore maturation protein [Clostridia bacterium]|nr:spore maturation protein [Clostridia bacterium]
MYDTFLNGVENGLKTLVKILPAMVAVMSAAAMLRESGITTQLASALKSILPFDIPEEIITVSMLRPVSGGGSIGLLAEILKTHGADSEVGRISSVIAASSETTLYVLMVYFGATRVKYTGRVLASALFGDFICVLTAVFVCKIIF